MSGEAHRTESTTAEKNVRTSGVGRIDLVGPGCSDVIPPTGEDLITHWEPKEKIHREWPVQVVIQARERWRRDELFRIFEWNAPWDHRNRSRQLRIRTCLLPDVSEVFFDDFWEYLGTILAGEKPFRVKASLEPSTLVRTCLKKQASPGDSWGHEGPALSMQHPNGYAPACRVPLRGLLGRTLVDAFPPLRPRCLDHAEVLMALHSPAAIQSSTYVDEARDDNRRSLAKP
ncbi:hypothetical protein B0H13DRAFT_1886889 [Mycena leptocephala]|nr:hypothetical protein B0H13DRAFT_1886889 [Mycena leptocephala]